MFPCLMVINATVYFWAVFMCHSRLTGSSRRCNHKKLNKEAPLFICLSPPRSSNMAHPAVSQEGEDQRRRLELCVWAEAKSCPPSLSLTLSLIPLPFPLHLSSYILFHRPPLPFACSRATAQIYRRWRDASGGQTRERLPV